MQDTKMIRGLRFVGKSLAAVYRGDRFKKAYEPRATGLVTAFGTWALLWYIGWNYTTDPGAILNEIIAFMTGSVEAVGVNNTGFLGMMPVIFLTVVVELPLCLLAGIISVQMVGKSTRHAVRDSMQSLQGKSLFKSLFVVVMIEEVVFRWLCLGLITKISFLSGGWGFYTVLILSNIIFALVHLSNYKEPRDRQAVRTVPQFIGGMMFSYIFVKYGFVASTLAHFASNAIIFSVHKLQRTDWVDMALIALHGTLALIAWSMMDKPITDVAIWFSGEETFDIAGWEMGDYVLIALFLSSCFNFLADVLLYDKNMSTEHNTADSDDLDIAVLIWALPLGLALGLGLVYGTYWLMGFIMDDVPFRILLSSLFLVGMGKNYSLSSAQRTFWVAIPSSYITICIVEALGFWGACLYLLVMVVIGIPQMILKIYDD